MLKSAAARSASSLSLQAPSCICRNLPAFHSLLVRLRLPRTLSRDRLRSCPAVVPAQSQVLPDTRLLQQILGKLCRPNRNTEKAETCAQGTLQHTRMLRFASPFIRADVVWLRLATSVNHLYLGLPVASVKRRASVPYWLMTSTGSTTFPMDLLIFLPCPSLTCTIVTDPQRSNNPAQGVLLTLDV